MLLAADIGATKTILAVYPPEGEPKHPLIERALVTSAFPDMDSLVGAFLRETGVSIDAAVFGIAAPVRKGKATMINMPWVITEDHLKGFLGVEKVRFLNDLEAIANAVPFLSKDDLFTLHEGVSQPGGAIAIIAPGTGLGEAFLIPEGGRYQCHPSEGGHTDFAPTGAFEMDLLRYLAKKFDHVSWERVCSGPGIRNIYSFLKDSALIQEPPWLSEELAASDDPTPIIIKAGTDAGTTCSICRMTIDIFTSILGSEAGNLALKVLATDGVYLAGGIPPRIVDALKHGNFLKRFQSKGRESFIVADIPIHVILNTRAGLIGAAAFGLKGAL